MSLRAFCIAENIPKSALRHQLKKSKIFEHAENNSSRTIAPFIELGTSMQNSSGSLLWTALHLLKQKLDVNQNPVLES